MKRLHREFGYIEISFMQAQKIKVMQISWQRQDCYPYIMMQVCLMTNDVTYKRFPFVEISLIKKK